MHTWSPRLGTRPQDSSPLLLSAPHLTRASSPTSRLALRASPCSVTSLLWARPPGHLGIASRVGLRSRLKAHKLGHGSGSWLGPACSTAGPGRSPPHRFPPHTLSVCPLSLPRAPPFSPLAALLCVACLTMFHRRPQAFSRDPCLGPGPPSPAHAHTSTARSLIRAQPASHSNVYTFSHYWIQQSPS